MQIVRHATLQGVDFYLYHTAFELSFIIKNNNIGGVSPVPAL
jgi:hypothetical protein